jgi:hypothetical protein
MPGAGGAAGTLVRFSDVYDLAGYGRLVGLLEQLEPVAGLALRHVNNDSFVFELQLRGTVEELARALEGGGRLVPEPGPLRPSPAMPAVAATAGEGVAPTAEPEADLYYRLVNSAGW